MKKITLILILILGISFTAHASDLRNDAALSGVKDTNAIFDISIGGKRLLSQLKIIHKTYEQLISFEHSPKFVLAFRGGATKFVTKGDSFVTLKDFSYKKEIQQKIKDFSELGFRMELCGIAAQYKKISTDEVLPEIKVVANGYISVIGYQDKGYSLVPIN